MSTLRPGQKVLIRTDGDLNGRSAFVTEYLGPRTFKKRFMGTETAVFYRASVPSLPNLPPMTFAADELELIK